MSFFQELQDAKDNLAALKCWYYAELESSACRLLPADAEVQLPLVESSVLRKCRTDMDVLREDLERWFRKRAFDINRIECLLRLILDNVPNESIEQQ